MRRVGYRLKQFFSLRFRPIRISAFLVPVSDNIPLQCKIWVSLCFQVSRAVKLSNLRELGDIMDEALGEFSVWHLIRLQFLSQACFEGTLNGITYDVVSTRPLRSVQKQLCLANPLVRESAKVS